MVRRTWRDLKINKTKPEIKKPKTETETQETTQEQNAIPPSFTVHSETPESERKNQTKNPTDYKKYAGYIFWPFKVAWSFSAKHHGFISAVATLAIAVLTMYYVKYAKKQWEAMNGQLTTMNSQLAEIVAPGGATGNQILLRCFSFVLSICSCVVRLKEWRSKRV